MKETPSNWRRANARGALPAFTIAPQPRCYFRDGGSASEICGELATHVRRGRWWFDDQYFCAAHTGESDEPLGADRTMRRVRLSVDVLLAGVSMNPTVAQAEALSRLEAAVHGLGGILEVQTVSSTFGAIHVPPGVAAVPAEGGGGG